MTTYAEAGVDIDKGNTFIKKIKGVVAETHRSGVLTGIGGFSSLFTLDVTKYVEPVLVSSTDGVGTKLKIAGLCNRHDTIGIDLVAMCVNDIIVSGAEPLFFLDYLSTGKLELDVSVEVVKGIAEGCKQARCSLVGGETAEMPGLYKPGDYDLAGFTVGIVDLDKIIDGSGVSIGNKIIGLTSSGLHSNGFSLVRKICFEKLGLTVDDYVEELGCSIGEELLKPTAIYVDSILDVLQNFQVNGIIHNTGGGFVDNIPRVLPEWYGAVVDPFKWKIPPIFPFLEKNGDVPRAEMFHTFNMGIGMMLIVHSSQADSIMRQLRLCGEHPFEIGEIFERKGNGERVEILNIEEYSYSS